MSKKRLFPVHRVVPRSSAHRRGDRAASAEAKMGNAGAAEAAAAAARRRAPPAPARARRRPPKPVALKALGKAKIVSNNEIQIPGKIQLRPRQVDDQGGPRRRRSPHHARADAEGEPADHEGAASKATPTTRARSTTTTSSRRQRADAVANWLAAKASTSRASRRSASASSARSSRTTANRTASRNRRTEFKIWEVDGKPTDGRRRPTRPRRRRAARPPRPRRLRRRRHGGHEDGRAGGARARHADDGDHGSEEVIEPARRSGTSRTPAKGPARLCARHAPEMKNERGGAAAAPREEPRASGDEERRLRSRRTLCTPRCPPGTQLGSACSSVRNTEPWLRNPRPPSQLPPGPTLSTQRSGAQRRSSLQGTSGVQMSPFAFFGEQNFWPPPRSAQYASSAQTAPESVQGLSTLAKNLLGAEAACCRSAPLHTRRSTGRPHSPSSSPKTRSARVLLLLFLRRRCDLRRRKRSCVLPRQVLGHRSLVSCAPSPVAWPASIETAGCRAAASSLFTRRATSAATPAHSSLAFAVQKASVVGIAVSPASSDRPRRATAPPKATERKQIANHRILQLTGRFSPRPRAPPRFQQERGSQLTRARPLSSSTCHAEHARARPENRSSMKLRSEALPIGAAVGAGAHSRPRSFAQSHERGREHSNQAAPYAEPTRRRTIKRSVASADQDTLSGDGPNWYRRRAHRRFQGALRAGLIRPSNKLRSGTLEKPSKIFSMVAPLPGA